MLEKKLRSMAQQTSRSASVEDLNPRDTWRLAETLKKALKKGGRLKLCHDMYYPCRPIVILGITYLASELGINYY